MSNSILAKMAVLISANTAAFDRNLKQSESAFARFTTSINRAGNTFGLAFGGVAAFQGLKYGLGIIQDFEHRMSEVKAITQASDGEFKKLRDSALELGKSTKFSAEQVAGLQVEFGKLGFSTEEILASTAATIQLATATGEDLAGSAEIAGSTLRAFGLDASEMQRVVDVMAASFNKSALGLSNFGEAIKYVAPVAAAANISLEETTAMLGVLADAGIRGSMAGTSLRKIISDVKGETGTLSERLQKLADKGLTGAEAMDEVGRTAYASLLILTKHVDKVNDATVAYQNSAGEAKKMANILSDDLEGDTKKLTSAFESLILSGSGVSKNLRGIVQSLTELINLVNSSGFVQAATGGINAFLRQVLIIPTVVKAIREYNAATKEAAITAKENADIIEEVWGKAKEVPQWLRDSSLKKYFEDQQLYLKNSFSMFGKQTEAVKENIVTLDSLKEKQKELVDQFGLIDVTDKASLKNKGNEIIAINKQIEALEALGRAQVKTSSLRLQFLPDLEAEGSTNPNLRNEQAANEAKEFAAALNEVATSAEFANGALVKLEQTNASTTASIKKSYVDIGPVISSTISSMADALGSAVNGTEKFGKVVTELLGGFMQQFGAALVATGVGKVSFDSFSGPGMIAAGFGLIAAGAALKATVNNRPDLKNTSSASSNSSYSTGSSISARGVELIIGQPIEFRIHGEDLVYVLNRQDQLNGRTR